MSFDETFNHTVIAQHRVRERGNVEKVIGSICLYYLHDDKYCVEYEPYDDESEQDGDPVSLHEGDLTAEQALKLFAEARYKELRGQKFY